MFGVGIALRRFATYMKRNPEDLWEDEKTWSLWLGNFLTCVNMECHLLGHFVKFICRLDQVCHFAIWIFFQVAVTVCQIVKSRSTFPSHPLHIAIWQFAVLQNCQAHFTMWTAPMSIKLPTNKKTSGLSWALKVFPICPKFCPKKFRMLLVFTMSKNI